MADLITSICDEIRDLSSDLARYLNDPDAYECMAGFLKARDCSEVVEYLDGKTTETVVLVSQLALSGDCLSWIAWSIWADGEVEAEELEQAYDLIRYVADLFVTARPDVYAQFAELTARRTGAFLTAYYTHNGWFGGAEGSPTQLMAADLCAAAGIHVENCDLLDRYEDLVVKIIVHITGTDGVNQAERKLIGHARGFVEGRRSWTLEIVADIQRRVAEIQREKQVQSPRSQPAAQGAQSQPRPTEPEAPSISPEQALEAARAELRGLRRAA